MASLGMASPWRVRRGRRRGRRQGGRGWFRRARAPVERAQRSSRRSAGSSRSPGGSCRRRSRRRSRRRCCHGAARSEVETSSESRFTSRRRAGDGGRRRPARASGPPRASRPRAGRRCPAGVDCSRTSMPPSSTGLRFRRACVTPRSAATVQQHAGRLDGAVQRHGALEARRRGDGHGRRPPERRSAAGPASWRRRGAVGRLGLRRGGRGRRRPGSAAPAAGRRTGVWPAFAFGSAVAILLRRRVGGGRGRHLRLRRDRAGCRSRRRSLGGERRGRDQAAEHGQRTAPGWRARSAAARRRAWRAVGGRHGGR